MVVYETAGGCHYDVHWPNKAIRVRVRVRVRVVITSLDVIRVMVRVGSYHGSELPLWP